MTAELKSTTEGRTMVLTLSNPAQRNALGPAIYAAGIEALNSAEDSDEVRSVVIVGEGAWFCAGGSLQRLRDNRREPPAVQAESIDALHSWIDSIRTFPKPVIAAVEGADEQVAQVFDRIGADQRQRGLLVVLDEQVEEESTVSEIVGQLRLVGDDGSGLLRIDARLGQRPVETTESA